jgi:hypothetical protein
MNAYLYAYIIILFIAVTPGVLLHVPPGGSAYVVATVHGILFSVIWLYTHKYIYHYTYSEGFQIQGFEVPEVPQNPTIEEQKKILEADQLISACVSDDMCETGKICRTGRCV